MANSGCGIRLASRLGIRRWAPDGRWRRCLGSFQAASQPPDTAPPRYLHSQLARGSCLHYVGALVLIWSQALDNLGLLPRRRVRIIYMLSSSRFRFWDHWQSWTTEIATFFSRPKPVCGVISSILQSLPTLCSFVLCIAKYWSIVAYIAN